MRLSYVSITSFRPFIRDFLIGIMIIGLALVLTTSTSFAASSNLKVNYGGSSWLGHLPIMVAIERGMFKDAGLDVTFNSMTSYERMAGIASERLDFTGTGASSVIGTMAKNIQNFYVVGTCDQVIGFEGLVAKKEFPTIESLRGKRIAVQPNSSAEITCSFLLKSHGLRYGKDVEIIHMNASDSIAAMARGSVDAAVAWEPYLSQLKDLSDTKMLGDETDTDLYKKYGYQISLNLVVLRKGFADRHPNAAKKLMEVYLDAADWVTNNRAEAVRLAIKGGFQKQSFDKLLPLSKRFDYITDPSKMISDGLFQVLDATIAFYHNLGKIDKPFDPRPWFRKELLPSR